MGNDQAHLNNSSTVADELFECVCVCLCVCVCVSVCATILWGWRLKDYSLLSPNYSLTRIATTDRVVLVVVF